MVQQQLAVRTLILLSLGWINMCGSVHGIFSIVVAAASVTIFKTQLACILLFCEHAGLDDCGEPRMLSAIENVLIPRDLTTAIHQHSFTILNHIYWHS